jgi:Polyketide cyclase / dehydrase and lipid transport
VASLEAVRSVAADLDITPERAWTLYSHPADWPSWAPHLRGASGLTGYRGEVRAGARGLVWVLGVLPLPVKVTWVDRGHSWSWKVGPVEMDHVVEEREDGGCRVAVVFRGSGLVEQLCLALYGAPAHLFLRNMGRVGKAQPGA